MRLTIVHDSNGVIAALTASSPDSPHVSMQLNPGQRVTEVDAPDITDKLDSRQITDRLAHFAQNYRVETTGITGHLVRAAPAAHESIAEDSDILTPSVDQFIEFIKFIADNNLWNSAKKRLEQKGIYDIPIGRRQIEAFREFVADVLLDNHPEMKIKQDRVAAMHARCGCGGPPPSSPHSPPPPWEDPGHWR